MFDNLRYYNCIMIKETNVRVSDVLKIMEKLKGLGITKMTCPDLEEFTSKAGQFIKEGKSIAGTVKLTGCKRILIYNLISSNDIESSACLKYCEDV